MPDNTPDYYSGVMGNTPVLQGGNILPSQVGPWARSAVPGGEVGQIREGLRPDVQNLGNVGSPMDWALEMAGGPGPKGRALKETIGQTAARVAEMLPAAAERHLASMPQLAERYPEMIPPEERADPKKGTTYLGKAMSPEELELQKTRKGMKADIEAGNYTPYFDPEKRFDVDPELYPTTGKTIEQARPAKEATFAKYQTEAENPEGLARLENAYQNGVKIGGADRWYQLGQLHGKFREKLGPEAGDREFKDFILNVAGTTAGASPENNLLMAAYARYARKAGLPPPNASYEIPHPGGGQYVTGNIQQGYEASRAGEVNPGQNPKRHNFTYNLLGHSEFPTLDDQMGQIWSGKPGYFGNTLRYAPHETVLNKLADKYGVSPREFQEVAWAGHKNLQDGYVPKPFIQTINEAIERTHRITGVPHEDVVDRALVRGTMPLYFSDADREKEIKAFGEMGSTMQRAGLRLPGENDPLSQNVEDKTGPVYSRGPYQGDVRRRKMDKLFEEASRFYNLK